MQLSETPTIRDLCCQQLLAQRLQEMEDSQAEGIRICSHGLSGTPVGSRYFMIAAAKVHLLKQAIRQNWPEFQDAEGNIYFVHPQPQDTLRPSWHTCVHVIVEFLPEDAVGDIGVVPALEESVVWDAFGNANAKHEACYYASQLHFGDIATKFEHLCMRAKYRCIVRAEGYRLHPEETTTIVAGACIQLHALPQVSAPSNEFVDYFWHGHQFLEATANLLGHWVMPAVTWSFHLLTEDGYQGHRDYNPSNTEFQSGDQAAAVMYHLWQELTPGALAFTGLIHIGDRSTLHFLGFPLDSEYYPGLVWRDVNQVPLISALWLPSVASVRDFSQVLAIGDESLDPSTLAVTSEDFLYQPDDRFKPRVGKLYFLRPFLPSDDEEVSLIQKQITSSNLQPDEVEGDAGWGVEECSSPPPSQAKPNPDIRVAFDQDIPITRRTSEGTTETIGRIIPPPRWEEHTLNRAAAAAGAHFRTASGQLTVQFRSWLVKHDDRRAANGQSRDFTLRAQLVVQIREKLKRVWNDHIGQGDLFQVIVVRPTPFADQNGETFLHIIAEVNRRPRSPLQPVLMAMRELASLSISRPIWCVGLLPEDFDTEDVFDLCLPVCERHQLLIPRGGATRGWLGPRQSRRAHAGLFIPIWWDERLTVQEAQRLHPGDDEVEESILLQRAAIIHDSPFGKAAEDVASLMQRPAPSSAPNLIPTFLAGLHLPLRTVLVDMDRPVTETVADFWPYETDPSSVVALYPVTDPPVSTRTGPQPMLIAHQSQDRFEQEHPDDVLAVVTVSFQKDLASRERRHRFKVLWVPWRGTRANYIDFFRMTGHCRMTHIICFLYLNNVIWPETDGAIRSLTNGDHLRLQIRADDNTDWCSFEYMENAARQRRIFESRPEPEDDPADFEQSSSLVSEPRSRSRSRNLPDEESDSHSLIQMRAVMLTSESFNDCNPSVQQPRDSYHDPCHPHVTDRWCDDEVHGAESFVGLENVPLARQHHLDILSYGASLPGYTEGNPDLSSGLDHRKTIDRFRPPLSDISNAAGNINSIGKARDDFWRSDSPSDGTPPAANFDEEPPNIEIPFSQVILDFEWMDTHFLLPCFEREDIAWHPNSLTWMALPWMIPDSCCTELWLYFDGSSLKQTQTAGAGVVAFARTYWGWGLCGFVSTKLESNTDSFQAEASAALIAVKLAHDLTKLIQASGGIAPELHLVFDNSTVGQQAVGNWTCKSRPDLGKAVRHLVQMTERRFSSAFHTHHVYGHCGDPGNEIVDTLARYAAEGIATDSLCDFVAYQTADFYLQSSAWFWMLFRQDLLPFWKEQSLFVPAHPTTCPPEDLLDRSLSRQTDTQLGVGRLHLKIATANVLSLKAGSKKAEHDAWGPARQELLLRQFFDHEFQIVAMQETRLRKLWKSVDERYIILKSAATDRGHFGIAICFSKTIPHGKVTNNDGTETQVCFTSRDLSIVAEDPRFLIVRVHTIVLKCLVLACHAPHSGADEDTRLDFWTDITQAIPKKYHTWDIVLLGDLNCRLGEEISDAIGPYQAETSNGKEHSCHEFLLNKGIRLPATFSEHQVGDPGTWRHTNGQWLRNDFIGIPSHWRPWKCSTWVEHKIDLALAKTDHSVAALSLELIFAIQHKAHHRTRKISEDDLDYVGEEIFWNLPQPTLDWQTDVHTHAANLQENLQHTLGGCKRFRPAKPRKSTLSEATWDLVCQKKEARSQASTASRDRPTWQCVFRSGRQRGLIVFMVFAPFSLTKTVWPRRGPRPSEILAVRLHVRCEEMTWTSTQGCLRRRLTS